MLNSKTAQKLKEQGFPFVKLLDLEFSETEGMTPSCVMCGTPFWKLDGGYYLYPPLERLINRCDKQFVSLQQYREWWIAKGIKDNTFIISKADEPIEAVGLLWIELYGNSKTKETS